MAHRPPSYVAPGCAVAKPEDPKAFLVVERVEDQDALVRSPAGPSAESRWVPLATLRSGFRRAMVVQDVPMARTRRPLGEGEVMATRILGREEQVLVHFYDSGEMHWLPFRNLRLIKGPKHQFAHDPFEPGQAERLRLKALAHALSHWNANTGALSRLDIDPLPHQIHLVHDILASGTLNWLIADDVGLGKTIEVGMLLHALTRRRGFERVLIVTPAGLTQQWQEELGLKFGLSDFRIYGRDFEVRDPGHWRLYPRVIASIDRLKGTDHLASVVGSGAWDLVVFDEAHRLTRRTFGRKHNASDRFTLAQALRQQTDNLLMLTATPHQGREDLFRSLLELLRPEWTDVIRRLSDAPEVLREMIYRNHKSDVTDAEGNFIFAGQTTTAVPVDSSPVEVAFDQALQSYLRRGYDAAQVGGRTTRTIGFVMTVYRKLAASSSAAILGALERRLGNLLADAPPTAAAGRSGAEADARFAGEVEEADLAFHTSSQAFFDGEARMLVGLIDAARRMLDVDTKLRAFVERVIPATAAENASEAVVVFTEYRGTQDYVAAALRARFGPSAVTLIHGGMDMDERRASMERFNGGDARFMVSTEAGGEGINLHRRCHVLVNYDIPWNPMRMVQRIGRLYRYGQKRRVLVFNLHAPGTIDGHVVAMMYERIERVVRDLSGLGGEFDERLFARIFGEVVALVDLEAVVEEARGAALQHTEDQVRDALARAAGARALQDEVLSAARRFDPNEHRGDLRLGEVHLRSFVLGMLAALGCEVLETTHHGQVWSVRLSETVARALKRGGQRVRLTASRSLAREDIEILDFDAPLFQLLVDHAKAQAFGGHHAFVRATLGRGLVAARLRWQNDQGRRVREEFAAFVVQTDGSVLRNPPGVTDWLAAPALDAPAGAGPGSAERVAMLRAVEAACEDHLAAGTNTYLHPMQAQVLAAAASTLDA